MTTKAPLGNEPDLTPVSSQRELLLRLVSGAVLAAVAIAALLVSQWSFLVLVMICAGLLLWEWGSATRDSGFDGLTLIQAICAMALVVFVAFGRFDLGAVVLGATAAVTAVSARQRGDTQAPLAIAGLFYVAVPAAALIWLRSDPNHGLAAVLFVLVVAWTADTAAYIGGRVAGGPKLAPRISPKKTWSGFLAGTLTPVLVGYAFAGSLGGTSPPALSLVALVLALACQAGDLAESAVKRHLGIKDMGRLIPGHGGLFDRIDSLLFGAVVAALIALLRDPTAPGAGLLIW